MDSSEKNKNTSENGNKSTSDEIQLDDFDPRVSFLYKAMLNRDPRKRRVKPVPRSQVQINFGGLDDSEEDSDFDISKHSKEFGKNVSGDTNDEEEDSDDDDDDDDEDVNLEDNEMDEEDDITDDDDDEQLEEEDDTDDDDDGDEDSDHDDTDLDSSKDGECLETNKKKSSFMESPEIKGLGQAWGMIDSDEDDEDYVPKKRKKKASKSGTDKSSTNAQGIKKKKTDAEARESAAQEDPDSYQDAAPQGRIKVIVCCVCLSDRSADDDEIVECDNCGISVHEGCYGISESHSTASTESSASTEPWFCDACKASAKPVCELCPNTGGIFKETDNGKWVHIVCALYTPGVAFGDVDKLSLVTLFEMPYSKWGARECSLCEDSRFSQTGVCINCDAGMCKAYFHVTCAQKEGLLTEAAPEEVMDIADPFFAYCKLHADKITSKIKRRNWLAIQSHVKTHTPSVIADENEKLRFHRKLTRHQEKYSITKLKRPPSWVPTQKMVRHLHTSPSAVRGFLRKAELMGVITQVHTIPSEKQEVRKKALGQPAFTAEFINYFMDRNVKVDNLKHTLADLISQNNKLQTQEKVVRKQYDQLNNQVNELQQKGNSVRREGESLCGILQDIYGKPVPHIPEVFKNRKRTRSPGKKEPSTSPTILINQCGICHSTTDQHLLAKCDSCKKHYHLGCLDPPLTRMPKKTKLFGWQCSYCVIPSTDDSARSAPDVDEPRRLRETIKEPDKFFHLSHIQDSIKSQEQKSLLRKRKRKQRDTARARRLARNTAKGSKTTQKSPSRAKAGTSKTVKPSSRSKAATSSLHSAYFGLREGETISDMPITCVVCNKDGLITDTVRCDECMLSYHLKCLEPPMKKSPKVRGYMWHCEACDMMDSSNEELIETRREEKRSNTTRTVNRDASYEASLDLEVYSDNSN
ncbi:PHD finger protein 14 [Biomphalaria glabrata]|nr:PHD finger protein 14 [Biomphalaria glabrata]